MKLIKYIALAGDTVFILWILYNAIDVGFQDFGSPQTILPMGLVVLLGGNIFLLLKQR
jgi:hypothetical protein